MPAQVELLLEYLKNLALLEFVKTWIYKLYNEATCENLDSEGLERSVYKISSTIDYKIGKLGGKNFFQNATVMILIALFLLAVVLIIMVCKVIGQTSSTI